jgi:hypothetical protein
MKHLKLLAVAITFSFTTSAQTKIKGNLATPLVLIPNFGIETRLYNHVSYQFDAQASFWEKFQGGPLKFLMIFNEIRLYSKPDNTGFFIGGHIGGSKYNIKKWNYYDLDKRQEGYNMMYGGTIGYQFKFKNRFNLEFFLGGGSSQGYYKGYYISTGERYDTYVKNFNKSGEWLPYRGGLMLVYQLK